MTHVKTYAALALMSLALSACATFKGKRSNLRAVTTPTAAKIYYHSELVGQSPTFLELRPGHRGSLQFRSDKYEKDVKLPVHYRWHESFLANLIWISPPLIVAGWVTDLLSGYAWEYDEIGIVDLSDGKEKNKPIVPVRKIAIAPPQTSSEFESDEIANELEPILAKKYPNASILPLEAKSKLFAEYNYDFHTQPRQIFRPHMYYDLGVTHIAESELIDDDTLRTTIVDVYTDQTVDVIQWPVPPVTVSRSHEFWRRVLSGIVSLVPNNISLDLSSTDNTNIEADNSNGQVSIGKNGEDHGELRFISLLGLRNVPHARAMRNFHFLFRFAPEIAYLNQNINFPDDVNSPELALQTTYNWQALYLGLGPELGLETPAGYLYAQVVPLWTESWINFNQGDRAWNIHTHAITTSVEFGFLFFATDEVNFRIFVNQTSIDEQPWTEAFHAAGSPNVNAGYAGRIVTGFSVGYYFPSGKRLIKKSVE